MERYEQFVKISAVIKELLNYMGNGCYGFGFGNYTVF